MSRRSATQTAAEKGVLSTMSNPLTEDYLSWLAPQIRSESDGNQNRTYEDLVRIMFNKEFVWLQVTPNDKNRLEDGWGLRVDFCHERHIPTDVQHKLGPCSFLEVLIGLSRRLAFAAGGDARGWAWTLINNLELHRMSDPIGRSRARRVDDILDRCIWRKYEPNGRGGFFPLTRPYEDQREIELWYQMAAFVSELHPEYR